MELNSFIFRSSVLIFNIISLILFFRLSVHPDGGYEGLVVRVAEDVEESECQEIIQRIKVRAVVMDGNCLFGQEVTSSPSKEWQIWANFDVAYTPFPTFQVRSFLQEGVEVGGV